MDFKQIPLNDLVVNPANDRHGDQGSETAAVEWLFENKPSEMLALIDDLADTMGPLDPPLVLPNGKRWVVFDGNRRITAMKALAGLVGVPPQHFTRVEKARGVFKPKSNEPIGCQIGTSVDVVNTTLSRRHGGTDHGRGQLRWDTRAKANYAKRVGANSQYPIAEAVETWLAEHGYPHSNLIKRSTLYRLINTKERQALFGISLSEDGQLKIICDEIKTLDALATAADDIVNGDLTLNNVLNKAGINEYLKKPHIASKLQFPNKEEPKKKGTQTKPTGGRRRPKQRESLIPKSTSYEFNWRPGHGKVERLWQELTYDLKLARNPVSIPLAFRTLIELVALDAGSVLGVKKPRSTASHLKQLGLRLVDLDLLTNEAQKDFERFCNDNGSKREYESLHRAVHGPGHVIAPDDLIAMWDIVEPFLVAAISAEPTSQK